MAHKQIWEVESDRSSSLWSKFHQFFVLDPRLTCWSPVSPPPSLQCVWVDRRRKLTSLRCRVATSSGCLCNTAGRYPSPPSWRSKISTAKEKTIKGLGYDTNKADLKSLVALAMNLKTVWMRWHKKLLPLYNWMNLGITGFSIDWKLFWFIFKPKAMTFYSACLQLNVSRQPKTAVRSKVWPHTRQWKFI